MIRTIGLVLVYLIASGAFVPDATIRLFLIGDSTIADKLPSKAPETGWGTPFKIFFDEKITIENHAKNGRSTRTFISEGLWDNVFNKLKSGDYVFIQFGHNDQSESKPDRYTTPEDYVKNLERFIAEARSKGAIPVLLTPVSRRKFSSDGIQVETHGVYPDLVRKTAQKLQVVLIDLDPLSRELYQNIGVENSKLLFLQLEKDEHPNYPDGVTDNTHFSELGARKIAQIVLSEIRKSDLDLKDHIIKK
jgi:lysophospholipase L1-like esterase